MKISILIKSGLRFAVVASLTLAAAMVIAFVVAALTVPRDAPLARMYRTEATLTALVKAVDTYYEAHGAYPPAGTDGLRLAANYLSRTANYFPEGPPPDGWERPYHYVPYTQYHEYDCGALKAGDQYAAPDTYQIYSLGADGKAGIHDLVYRQDNLCSWDKQKSWRPVYRVLNKAYRNARKQRK